MNQIGQTVVGMATSVVVGTCYGAVAGAAFGTAIAPVIGTIFGFFFGAFGGAVFGALGGAIGGPLGWGFGGFVGGLMSSGLLNSGRPQEILDFVPAVILSSIGLFIGWSMQKEHSGLPLLAWLRQSRQAANWLNGFNSIRLVLGLLAVLCGSYLLGQRFTAPETGGFMSAVDD